MKRYTLYKEIRDTVAEWGCDCEEHETTCPQCAAIENTRVLEKRGAALLDALRAVHDWRGLCDADSIETFDRVAQMFYSETGMLRPGKDQAAALGGYPTDEERAKKWAEWCDKKNAELDAQIRAALARAGGAP